MAWLDGDGELANGIEDLKQRKVQVNARWLSLEQMSGTVWHVSAVAIDGR